MAHKQRRQLARGSSCSMPGGVAGTQLNTVVACITVQHIDGCDADALMMVDVTYGPTQCSMLWLSNRKKMPAAGTAARQKLHEQQWQVLPVLLAANLGRLSMTSA